MTHHIHKTHIHCRELRRAVFLLAVLTSMSAQAATPATTSNETAVADNNVSHVTVQQTPVDPYEAIKWRNATSKNSVQEVPVHKNSRFKTFSDPRRIDTKKVFKEDFDRVLVTVGSAKNTKMIWLAD
jgi:hypothetical protein